MAALAAGTEAQAWALQTPGYPPQALDELLDPEAVSGPALTLEEALRQGESWVRLRLRGESVEQDGFASDATALTLRTVLGYETASYEGFRLLLEAEDISPFGGEAYNSTINGSTDRPTIADPNGTEIHQAYLSYEGLEGGKLKLGRQQVNFGRGRFIGAAPWRQNHTSFDAYSFEGEVAPGLHLHSMYAYNANRPTGDLGPGGNLGGSTIALKGSFETGDWGRVSAYYFDLDNDAAFADLSARTVGVRWSGSLAADEDLDVTYHAEFANQRDGGSNPGEIDADYLRLQAGLDFETFQVSVGSEVLGGSGAAGDKFSTPLASRHGPNGWADQFLNTPDDGLEDLYVSLHTTARDVALIAAYHEYSSDAGDRDYGSEFNLSAVWKLASGPTLGFKYADFSADDAAFRDTTKAWIWAGYSF